MGTRLCSSHRSYGFSALQGMCIHSAVAFSACASFEQQPQTIFPDVVAPEQVELTEKTACDEVFTKGSAEACRVRLPPEVSVQNFFVRGKALGNIVDLLKKGAGEADLQQALQDLPVPFDSLFATQVLRVDLPCDVAFAFFHWLDGLPGFQHNEYTYGVMLNNLGRAGRLDDMQQLFDHMKAQGYKVTSVTLSNVMRWLHKAKDMRRVAQHWNTLRRAGTKPSAAIYTAYIDFLVRANRHTKIAVIFEEMLRLNCLPNTRTYTVFIEHLVIAGNLEAAVKIMKCMQTMRVVPSRVVYRIVINGYAKTGNSEMVLSMLKEMKEHFHRPTKELIPAVAALQAAGKLTEAATLREEIRRESGNSVDEEDVDGGEDVQCVTTVWRSTSCSHLVFDMTSFLDALYEWNSEVEREIEEANLQWESSLVMGVLRRLRDAECLWHFFHWLKWKVGFKHDSYTCALLLQRILRSRSTVEKIDSSVRDLFEGLRNDEMRFTVPLFNLVIRHYVAVGEAEKACNMFNLITDFGLVPNEFSYALVIQGFAKNRQGKKATQMLKDMEARGFRLDGNTCAELITCLGLAGKTERAYALFCHASESGRQPGSLEYKAMMGIYFRGGNNGMALNLYEDMRKAGIKPTQDMYDVIAGILRKACRHSDIQVLTEERRLLNFFDGNRKVLQENLLQVLFAFMEGIKPRKCQRAYVSACN